MLTAALLLLAAQPQVELGVAYSTVGGPLTQMDIYRPEGVSTGTTAAVLVVHGGSWMMGKREDMAPLCKAIAARGMLAATVSYRLAPKIKWPAMLDDCQTAVRYLRANASKYNIDPDKIGATGASAGGQISLLLGMIETRNTHPTEYPTTSSRVAAVFDLFGPVDMSIDFKKVEFIFQLVLGKKRADAADEIKNASPVNFIDQNTAPTFILQGKDDPLVPYTQSQLLESKLKAKHIPCELDLVEGMVHDVDVTKPAQADGVKRGIDWLDRYLNHKALSNRRAA